MAWEPYDSRGRPNTPKSNPRDIALLDEPLRSRAAQMIADCPHRGELGVVSAVRDPGTQWDLRLERVGLANIWKSPPKGNPTTAVPARWNPTTKKWEGGSRHQVGEALDFGGTERAMRWMSDNREAYGLARTVTKERWHVEANRRDVLTGRIHNRPTVPIAPFGADPEEFFDMDEATFNRLLDAKLKPLRDQVQKLHDDYGVKGKGVRQTIAEIDTRTEEIVVDTRALTKRKG